MKQIASMTPIRSISGPWAVVSDTGELVKFACNADAWRWIDREAGSPLSPAQARSAYLWRRQDFVVSDDEAYQPRAH